MLRTSSTAPVICVPSCIGWRKDFGLSGMSDPDTFLALVELMLSEGRLVVSSDKSSVA